MKQMPLKARELTIAGIVMSACSLAWFVAPEAKIAAGGFIAFGAGFVGYALYLWRRSAA